jgi:hypothetical protein
MEAKFLQLSDTELIREKFEIKNPVGLFVVPLTYDMIVFTKG